VGKTTLLVQWAKQSGLPTLYWTARRETASASRQSLARALWQWAYPDEPMATPPTFDSWEQLFQQMGRMLAEKPAILVFDEFSYAVESDSSLPSYLQVAWDHIFQEKPITLILSGSHIGMMVDLLEYQAPLYGRTTAQLRIKPLPFAALSHFFPNYSAAERVATYAVLGGVPAYLERFDSNQSITENIRQHLFQQIGMFRSEPLVLISDLVRETRNYEVALRSIANGAHTPAEITRLTGIAAPNLSPYLRRLQELGFVQRRIPATIPREQRKTTTRSRYHLSDPYLRFYFRFIEPNLEMIEMDMWVILQAKRGNLAFLPEVVGSHWAKNAQIDVVAINWRAKMILLGECKWGSKAVGPAVIQKLVERAQSVIPPSRRRRNIKPN